MIPSSFYVLWHFELDLGLGLLGDLHFHVVRAVGQVDFANAEFVKILTLGADDVPGLTRVRLQGL